MKKLIISVFVFFAAFELLLRLSGIFNSTNEKSSGEYYPQFRQYKPTWFHTWTSNSTVNYSQIEFTYLNSYNDIGHRESDFSAFEKDTTTEKIICIGDSFTEGDGAPADSTWVKRLEVLLNNTKNKKPYELYNAGVCGSDVYFSNTMLIEKLAVLKPKMVFECVNSSDILDIIYRGGKERFNQDGTTTGKIGPRWEPVYKYSHVFRAFIRTMCGYDDNLLKVKEAEKLKSGALKLIKEQVEETADFCRKSGIKYILVIHPCPHEIYYKVINQQINTTLKDEPNVVNLFSPMINFYDKNDLSDYSWKINGHFNSKGYFVMGDLIFEEFSKNAALYK